MSILENTNSLRQARGSIARLVRASRFQDRAKILEFTDYQIADKLIDCLAMLETTKMLMKDDMASLLPFRSEGCWYTRGRLGGKSLLRHLGHDKLLILSNKSRLATLLLIQAHEMDHRKSPGDALHRTRQLGVLIVRGRGLAKSIVNSCTKYKLLHQVTLEQQMGELPHEMFEVPCSPFRAVCVDFLGPVTVRGEVNKKARMKAFPCVFQCLYTEAVHPVLFLCADYSSQAFMKKFKSFMSIRGKPDLIITNLGFQLCKAGKFTGVDAPEWQSIESEVASQGIQWIDAPPATAWRNGKAEAMVKALKKSLHHLQTGEFLTFDEYADLLFRASSCINLRPLGVRHHGGAELEDEVITPNLMLLGSRSPCPPPNAFSRYLEDNSIHTRRLTFEEWWRLWYCDVFPSLLPVAKWRKEHPNLDNGDIVLV